MPKLTRSVSMAIALTIITVLVAGSSLALGAAPRPVIPVKSLGDSLAPSPKDVPAESEPDKQAPECHVGGSSASGSGMVHAVAGLPGQLAAPRPVLPVGLLPQPASTCETRLSLSLTVESRKDRKPDGADATLEELVVPRSVLESGFQTTLAARSRAVQLSDPGDEWEVKRTSCTCGGASAASTPALLGLVGPLAAGALTSYPAPVIPMPFPGGGGSVSCPPPGTTSTTTIDLPVATGQLKAGLAAGAPRPVIPVKSLLPKGPQAEPQPPERAPARVSWDRSGSVRVDDPDRAGAEVVCHWVVEHTRGHLTVRTVTEPSGREDQARYHLSPQSAGGGRAAQSLQGSASGDERKLRHGSWTLEARNPGKAWQLKDSRCSEADAETPSGAQGTTAQVGIDPGDRVTCTYTWKLSAPKAGRWKGINHPGKATCSGSGGAVTYKLERSSDFARFIVKQGGDRVVMRGRGGDSITVTVNRDPDDPLRYTGSASKKFQGMRARWDYDLELIDDKHMKGTVSMTAKGKDARCDFRRKLTLAHAGG